MGPTRLLTTPERLLEEPTELEGFVACRETGIVLIFEYIMMQDF